MRRPGRVTLALAALLMTQGCAPSDEAQTASLRFVSRLAENLRDQVPPTPLADMRRAIPLALDRVDGPIFLLEQEKFDQGDFFVPAERNGAVVTWGSDSQATVALDGSVIVATRGFGDDLMAADPGPAPALLAAREAGRYRRTMTFLNGEEQPERVVFGCALAPAAGTANVWEEYCGSEQVEFVNTYAFGPDGGVVRAEQWIGFLNETVVLRFLRR